jgi:hypothetical protein
MAPATAPKIFAIYAIANKLQYISCKKINNWVRIQIRKGVGCVFLDILMLSL